MLRTVVPSALLVLVSATASAQTTEPAHPISPTHPTGFRRPYVPLFGANVGVQQFFDQKTRDVFGDHILSITPAFGPTFTKAGFSILPGASAMHASRDVLGFENKAFILGIGPTLRYGLVNPATVEVVDDQPTVKFRRFAPFIDLSLQLVYMDVSVASQTYGVKRVTGGATLAVGTSITKNALVKFTLQEIPKLGPFDFSNAGFEVGVRF